MIANDYEALVHRPVFSHPKRLYAHSDVHADISKVSSIFELIVHIVSYKNKRLALRSPPGCIVLALRMVLQRSITQYA